jgi:cyclase
MLRPRIIPCILIDSDDVVKTVNFNNNIYIGDPLNTVRLFNEKKSDEILIIDISATRDKKKPNFKLIENIAEVARMPVAYGGGIKNKFDALKIFSSGIEKISVSSLFFENEFEVREILKAVGSQSLVVTLDIKKIEKKYSVFLDNGKKFISDDLISLIKKIEDVGLGEIIINNIDRDGTMEGYDEELIEIIYSNSNIPLTVLGGVGKREHIQSCINKFGNMGYACGSYFIFKGPRKAVLISYENKFK